jgi:hypothetical protein
MPTLMGYVVGEEEEAVAGAEAGAVAGVGVGDMRHMDIHPMLGMHRMVADTPLTGLGIHPMQPHGDRPLPRNRRLSSSKTNKDSSSSKWRRSTSGSKNSLLRKKSKGEGTYTPHPLANRIANYYILSADMIKVTM